MDILIFGSSGVVGTHLHMELTERGHRTIKVARNSHNADINADASNFKELEEILKIHRPDIVINAIKPALSTDEMESKKEMTYKINTLIPEKMAELQTKYLYRLVQLSSDWVYEGKENEIYGEESLIYPRNYYSYTKAIAEERIRSKCNDYLIIRTEGVFGIDEKGTNTLMRIKNARDTNKPFSAFMDQYSQPISGKELARMTTNLIEKNKNGTYNVVGPENLSRYEFSVKVCDILGWKCDIAKTSIKTRTLVVPPQLNIDISKLEKEIGKVRGLDQQIREIKEMIS